MNKYLLAAQAIEIPDTARLFLGPGTANFMIETPHGSVSVEAGRCDSIFVRGTPEAINGFGLIEPDWLPGLPGRGATTQMVCFEDGQVILPVGKNRRGKRTKIPTRIIIRAWGYCRRTVDVQIPISEKQQRKVDALWAVHEKKNDRHNDDNTPQRPTYRTEGNLIYLLRSAGMQEARP